MLKPQDAYNRLTSSDRGGFDDPTEASGPPVRWHWQTTPRGTFLAHSPWRSPTPHVYSEYPRPS
jgi:hypothetical protein